MKIPAVQGDIYDDNDDDNDDDDDDDDDDLGSLSHGRLYSKYGLQKSSNTLHPIAAKEVIMMEKFVTRDKNFSRKQN